MESKTLVINGVPRRLVVKPEDMLVDVLRDQFFFMQRCGFDAIQPKAGKYSDAQLEESLASLKDFSAPYQAAVDQPEPLFRRAQRAT